VANPLRTRSATAKVTEEEYEKLEATARSQELTISDWCRNALLAAVNADANNPAALGPPASPELLLLAEILGIRMLLLNLIYPLGCGETLTAEKLQSVIAQADAKKVRAAMECLRQLPRKV
jgi:hypothetical protein